MKPIVKAALIAYAVNTCAGCAINHTNTNRALYASSAALIACDVGQTIWVSNGGRWDRLNAETGKPLTEANPMLGSSPSVGTLSTVLVTDLVVHSAIMLSPLPKWVKTAWAGGVVGVEAAAVGNNYDRTSSVCGLWGGEAMDVSRDHR